MNTTPANSECKACANTGMSFPDGTRACQRHTTPEWKTRLAELDSRGEALGVPIDHWPTSTVNDIGMRQRMVQWAENAGLGFADTRCQGLHWLSTGMCQTPGGCGRPGWADHVTNWHLDGTPALHLSHVMTTPEQEEELLSEALSDGTFRTHLEPSWYEGNTLGVYVWNPNVHSQLFG